jgi:hypothetical protein
MKHLLIYIVFILPWPVFAQDRIQSVLSERGEAIVVVNAEDLQLIPGLPTYSINKIENGKASLYINQKQFEKLKVLGISLTLVPKLKSTTAGEILMAETQGQMQNWDHYPTYDAYLQMMQNFALAHSTICRLDTIGYSENNRLLLAIKISDNVRIEEPEPKVLLTSSMHGDELTGYVLMLQLIDSLLAASEVPRIKNIINNTELWINPLANPDGAYFNGNHTVEGAKRFNANSVDLNRNFPDFVAGSHPAGDEWQAETKAMMDFMHQYHFSLSANFHGGVEVMNYPWDCQNTRHADDTWFEFVSREYADTAHVEDKYYMTDFENGVTNGSDWSVIYGGRQDYVTYFLSGREITMEISTVKTPNSADLPYYWRTNKKSFLNYIEQSQYGVHGTVQDIMGNPIAARVFIDGHDTDSSHVWSDKETGKFFRLLKAGNYTLNISACGYETNNIDVEVLDYEKNDLCITLDTAKGIADKSLDNLTIAPNPVEKFLQINSPNCCCVFPLSIEISNSTGLVVYKGEICSSLPRIDVSWLPEGVYLCRIASNALTKGMKFYKK